MTMNEAMLERERKVIEEGVRDLRKPVTIRSYTSDIESWYSQTERQLLERIASASPQISLEILAESWPHDREVEVGIARTPAIKLIGAREYAIVFYGQPDGYELATFMELLKQASEGQSGLSPRSIERINALAHPIHLEVLVSST